MNYLVTYTVKTRFGSTQYNEINTKKTFFDSYKAIKDKHGFSSNSLFMLDGSVKIDMHKDNMGFRETITGSAILIPEDYILSKPSKVFNL